MRNWDGSSRTEASRQGRHPCLAGWQRGPVARWNQARRRQVAGHFKHRDARRFGEVKCGYVGFVATASVNVAGAQSPVILQMFPTPDPVQTVTRATMDIGITSRLSAISQTCVNERFFRTTSSPSFPPGGSVACSSHGMARSTSCTTTFVRKPWRRSLASRTRVPALRRVFAQTVAFHFASLEIPVFRVAPGIEVSCLLHGEIAAGSKTGIFHPG